MRNLPGPVLLFLHRPEVIFKQISAATFDEINLSRKVTAKIVKFDGRPAPTAIETLKIVGNELKFFEQGKETFRINLVNFKVTVTTAPSLPFDAGVLDLKLKNWASANVIYNPDKCTLKHIPKHEYAYKYAELKHSYGKELAENWQEATDPQKFVYEDLAISTYIILLLDVLKDEIKSVLDIGCGNASSPIWFGFTPNEHM